jgi:4-diphosphocytidyl-2C-methyl-D-erythritol kinase
LKKVSDEELMTKRAFKACKEDVENESKNEKEIYTLAEQNAKNIVEALINPFIQQLDSEYEVIIKGEE